MNEFMMIFRHIPDTTFQPTMEQIEASIRQWQDWIASIAAQGKFVSTNQLGFEGKTISHDDIITDGPYAEVKEIIGGYIIVKAASLAEATQLAKGCPIFMIHGTVEVRNIMKIQ
jgi:hypothetical protein